MDRWAWVAFGVGLAACSGSSSSTSGAASDGGSGGDSGARVDAGGGDAGDAGVGNNDGGSDAGGGSGTVTGSADGSPFPSIAAAYWIGAPDSASTTVVYVFSKPVKCSEITSAGWDAKIPAGTQLLEMKAFGTMPATYKVTTSMTPAPGEASTNHVVNAGTPTETIASGGTLTLTALNASTNATGTFSFTFGSDSISGSFVAAYCAGGHEP